MPGCTVIHGHARFEAADRIRVGDQLLTAPKIFLNVGGRAVVPDFPGVEHVPYLTNSSILQLDRVPEHLVIIGGSYVGLEFAQMFRRFGAEVTVVEKARGLLPARMRTSRPNSARSWKPKAFRFGLAQSVSVSRSIPRGSPSA